ncbi:MAG: hypothetical protein IJA76_05305 [Clostridia bacterium]|nr:hypothetical protein [Clostridia bacterium]MBQ4587532.1 hypothetical protein [Clostridia bacterium]
MYITRNLGDVKDEKVQEKFNIRYETRGDPDFIEYINNAIIGEHFETKDDLIAFVKSLYYKLTGKEMKEGGYAFCPKFVKGEGMSDGIISDVVLKPDGMVDRLAKYIGLE